MPSFASLTRSLGRQAKVPLPSWTGQGTNLGTSAKSAAISTQVAATSIIGLTYTAVTKPSWITVSPSGLITGTAAWNDVGPTTTTSQSNTIQIRATDASGQYVDSPNLTLTVTSTAPSAPIVAISAGGFLGQTGNPLFLGNGFRTDFTYTAPDSALTFSSVTLPTWATLSTVSATVCRISGTVPNTQTLGTGFTPFTVRARDAENQYIDTTPSINFESTILQVTVYDSTLTGDVQFSYRVMQLLNRSTAPALPKCNTNSILSMGIQPYAVTINKTMRALFVTPINYHTALSTNDTTSVFSWNAQIWFPGRSTPARSDTSSYKNAVIYNPFPETLLDSVTGLQRSTIGAYIQITIRFDAANESKTFRSQNNYSPGTLYDFEAIV